MKRLGFYSGRIYTQEDYNNDRIHECCHQLSDSQANDENYCDELFERYHKKCDGCHGCPESQIYYGTEG